jgi:hypothetical protein
VVAVSPASPELSSPQLERVDARPFAGYPACGAVPTVVTDDAARTVGLNRFDRVRAQGPITSCWSCFRGVMLSRVDVPVAIGRW